MISYLLDCQTGHPETIKMKKDKIISRLWIRQLLMLKCSKHQVVNVWDEKAQMFYEGKGQRILARISHFPWCLHVSVIRIKQMVITGSSAQRGWVDAQLTQLVFTGIWTGAWQSDDSYLCALGFSCGPLTTLHAIHVFRLGFPRSL